MMNEQSPTRRELLDQLVEIAHQLGNLESEYQECKELFTTVFQKATIGILILRDKTILLANPTFCQVVGAPLQEIVGTEFTQYVKPDLASEMVRRYEERLAGKARWADRTTVLKKDGSAIDV